MIPTVFIGAVAVCGLISVVGARRLIAVVTVIGGSMAATYSDGQRLLARRWGLRRLRVGDVVVLDGDEIAAANPTRVAHLKNGRMTADGFSTGRPTAGTFVLSGPIIKRVIAVAGDPVPHDRVPSLGSEPDALVPARQILVLGDSPQLSADSRVFGYVHMDHVLAVVIRPLG